MRRFLIIMSILIAAGVMFMRFMLNATPKAQAMAVGVTVVYTQLPTDTPMATMTPLPTIDYRATDQAYQLQMEAQRNDMIKAQLAHDEEMLRQQVELARINATATAAGTQMVMVNDANTLQAGQLTAVSIQATSTAEAPQQAAALLQVQTNAKNAEANNIAFWIGLSFMCLFLLTGSYFFVKKAKSIKAAEIMHELQRDDTRQAVGLDVTLRDEKDPVKSEHYQLPCSMEQLIELAEMVVNGARSFPYNHMESNSRTFKNRRDDLRAVRDVLDKARLVITNVRTGEGVVSERGAQFFEWVFDNRDVPDGFELGERTPSPTA